MTKKQLILNTILKNNEDFAKKVEREGDLVETFKEIDGSIFKIYLFKKGPRAEWMSEKYYADQIYVVIDEDGRYFPVNTYQEAMDTIADW